MDVTATVTDDQIAVNAVLGVNGPNSRLITTGQTSGCYSVGAFNYKAIYALAPVEVTVLELP